MKRRQRPKGSNRRVQGVLFSEQEMQALIVCRPPVEPAAVQDEVSPGVSDYEVLEHAVRDNLRSAGYTDPGQCDSFMGWLGMLGVVSCRDG